MRIAILQLPSIGMGSSKLESYARVAHQKGVKLMLLGEYLLNPFFKELVHTPVSMIAEQSAHQVETLKMLASKYDLTFVAPIVTVKKKECTKTIAKINGRSISYYPQQFLINYPHWNEEKFFNNPIEPVKPPMIFALEGFKFAVMAGFELHFDPLWDAVSSKAVDAVLVPSASTFESHNRWRELIKMRAFTHNCYILRANRIGEYFDDKHAWKFYGDSMVVSPDGEIEADLGNTEELLIVDLDRKSLSESRKGWGFKEALRKRR
ncbi:MAG: carbon-nitrogen hydrolase family protein [Sulfuricurvum sp.]|jgi:predicted amidohydrolase|uniref:carbon-nitrogen hydrolase family protein n=1 Tax=Sulfuricurvum sp. TaxID=2025608 RepID=UPI002626C29A|nr:carbon-nitrogen hydrolase family protein [Sulfuricurvum sp.]MDD2838092.1 carbon-nitrogen hydrolase family protein [Sulfuricurvum sp.]MDD3596520.1 carbon-nitrogen hydrolase family protein [Sulfuricurvum sp.]MDD4883247.1 carbon-nitrogen hydrolase family protein [Sulfuricurvum sp.]